MQELDAITKMSAKEKTIFHAATDIPTKLKGMQDTMPWPPQARDLSDDEINLGERLKRSEYCSFWESH